MIKMILHGSKPKQNLFFLDEHLEVNKWYRNRRNICKSSNREVYNKDG